MKILVVMGFIAFSYPTDLMSQTYQGLEAVKLPNAIDGDSVSLDNKASGSLVVIIFTSNFCPYSKIYEERIIRLHEEYSKLEVKFFLVNPNRGPDDSLEEMKKKATESGFTFPYLRDENQTLTNIMGATRTPEVFLIKVVDSGFSLIYHGAIDDNPQAPNDVELQYLKTAIDQALEGQPIERSQVKVTGCIIKS